MIPKSWGWWGCAAIGPVQWRTGMRRTDKMGATQPTLSKGS